MKNIYCYFILLFFVTICGCSKEKLVSPNSVDSTIDKFAKIKVQILAQKAKISNTYQSRFDSLMNSLNWKNTTSKIFADGTSLISVPSTMISSYGFGSNKAARNLVIKVRQDTLVSAWINDIVSTNPLNDVKKGISLSSSSEIQKLGFIGQSVTLDLSGLFKERDTYSTTLTKIEKRTLLPKLTNDKRIQAVLNPKVDILNEAVKVNDEIVCYSVYLETTLFYTDGTSVTYDQYLGTSCSGYVCSTDPTMNPSSGDFLFRNLCDMGGSQPVNLTPEQILSELISMDADFADYFGQMNDAEKALAHAHPIDAYKAYSNSQDAKVFAENDFPGDQHNTIADAYRHGVWNALNAASIGIDMAKQFADAHESTPGNPALERQMDLTNNQIGRDAYTALTNSNPNTFTSDLIAQIRYMAITGQLVMISNNQLVPSHR